MEPLVSAFTHSLSNVVCDINQHLLVNAASNAPTDAVLCGRSLTLFISLYMYMLFFCRCAKGVSCIAVGKVTMK